MFHSFPVRKFAYPIVCAAGIVCVLLAVIGYQYRLSLKTPPGTRYAYVTGHAGDYYGYIYMIRRGREGHLLYRNPFTEIRSGEGFVHPFFHIVGWLSRPFSAAPFMVYSIVRATALCALLTTVFVLIYKTFPSGRLRITASVLFLSATSWWTLSRENGVFTQYTAETYSDYFDIFSKYNRIPPHHLFGLICFIGIFLVLSMSKAGLKNNIILVVLAAVLGFVQPYLSLILMISIIIFSISRFLLHRRKAGIVGESVLVCVVSGIALLVNQYVLLHILNVPFASVGILQGSDQRVMFVPYISAIGPLLFIALGSVFHRKYRTKPIVAFLYIWAFAPIVLFLLPVVSNVNGAYRLYQTFQQIPLALLSAISLDILLLRMNRIAGNMVIACFLGASILYGGIRYGYFQNRHAAGIQPYYFNYYIPVYLDAIFRKLNTGTKPDSVVLANDVLSGMIPAMTHNKVMIGQESDANDYQEKLKNVNYFYSGHMTQDEVEQFLGKHKIAYVMFGLNSPPLESTPYDGYGVWRDFYNSDGVRVVEVKE
jgi:hypothetical protein